MLSHRKLAMRVLGRPLNTGGNNSPRPASQRAAALVLTAAMLTTFTAPAFAGTWYIEDGDMTMSPRTRIPPKMTPTPSSQIVRRALLPTP